MIRVFSSSFDKLIRIPFSARKFSKPTRISRKGSEDSDGDNEFSDEYTDIEDSNALEPEQNFVKLIGTVYGDPIDLKRSGDKSCTVIQRCNVECGAPLSISHKLRLHKEFLQSNGLNGLTKNQKLNICGIVRSIPFETIRGETKNALHILPKEIELCKNGEVSLPDICIVLQTAHIDTIILHGPDVSTFNLRTHYPKRNQNGEFTDEMLTQSHSVVVYDPDVRNFLRENLNKDDYVFVEGYLDYESSVTPESTTRISGHIVAVHIEKIEQN